jgi:hypothetical protein
MPKRGLCFPNAKPFLLAFLLLLGPLFLLPKPFGRQLVLVLFPGRFGSRQVGDKLVAA